MMAERVRYQNDVNEDHVSWAPNEGPAMTRRKLSDTILEESRARAIEAAKTAQNVTNAADLTAVGFPRVCSPHTQHFAVFTVVNDDATSAEFASQPAPEPSVRFLQIFANQSDANEYMESISMLKLVHAGSIVSFPTSTYTLIELLFEARKRLIESDPVLRTVGSAGIDPNKISAAMQAKTNAIKTGVAMINDS
jgi:hypothetical protein